MGVGKEARPVSVTRRRKFGQLTAYAAIGLLLLRYSHAQFEKLTLSLAHTMRIRWRQSGRIEASSARKCFYNV